MSNRPHITLFTLGGTISAHHSDRLELCDYQTGHYHAQDFINALPELSELAQIEWIPIKNVTSTAIDTFDWFNLKKQIEQQLKKQDAVVITQGTNTLEETAYFLHHTLNTTKPVIITGAQKPFSALGSDAYFNLLNSFRVAACPAAAGKGVLTVFNDKIYSAQDVSKTHTYHLEAFQAPNNGPIGRIEANRTVHFMHAPAQPHTSSSPYCTIQKPDRAPYIPIVYSHAGADSQLLEALLQHTQLDGLVIAGTGAGRCSPKEEQALYSARKQGIPIVMTSRVGAGGVVPIKYYSNLELITLGDLSPQKARIWLLLHVLSTNSTTH
ncbi:asparaginase [Denitrificimonas sp. JX-1]|uniref:Asparaginase n=1 Tax=Denitrificimonas halotolerans TaxID=3098930 RepID=A0ABU5GS72_9GAMM|nr:asparaginase [Denitrificimonas sp. JX-1]MDY7219535.1 asparaginase [Denitrificimonas sp. JX-1]